MKKLVFVLAALGLLFAGTHIAVDAARAEEAVVGAPVVVVEAPEPESEPVVVEEVIEVEEEVPSGITELMSAKGHTFSYGGDVSVWIGWYFDTVWVGSDRMLVYDSIAPSMLRLSLVTHSIDVDLGDPRAEEKMRRFMEPLDGFRRFSKDYTECLESVYDEDNELRNFYGTCIFEADYCDSCSANADKINSFVCSLADVSDIDKANVPDLAAFYAGYTKSDGLDPAYRGPSNNVDLLGNFVASRTFDGWKRSGGCDFGFHNKTVSLHAHVANQRFVTYGKYEYELEGIGHGMYVATFRTLDLGSGKAVCNADIFKPGTLEKVRHELLEVIARDKKFRIWYPGVETASDVEKAINGWQSRSDDGKRPSFDLPEAALTDNGVIFSFQPYEIDCWAAGAYHFTVPYAKLKPYLTPAAQALLPPPAREASHSPGLQKLIVNEM